MNASGETTTPRWRVAVVGGGLSGLAAAHRLLELAREQNLPLDIDLLEAGSRLGGVIQTRRIGEYLVEMGADSFVTNKPWAVSLCRRLGLEDCLIPTNEAYRRSFVLRRGRLVPTPAGFTLLAPSQFWSVLCTGLLSPWGKLRMAMEYFVPPRSTQREESLAEFVRRRFGREALERLVQPMVGGIYTSDPEKLSLEATMPQFVQMEREHGSLIRALRSSKRGQDDADTASGARYGLFVTLRDGMSSLLDALEQRVRAGARVHLQRHAVRLSLVDDNGVSLSDREGRCDVYRGVVLALPAYRAAEIVGPSNARLGELLDSIEYASTAIVVSGHKLEDISGRTDAFGFVVPAAERRNILAVSYSSRKFPGRAPDGRVLLRTFVGGAMQPELFGLDDEAIRELVREELAAILGVQGVPEFCEVARYTRAMPQYHVGHRQKIREIESQIADQPRLQLAGNAYDGVGVPDSIHSGERAAERLVTGLTT